MFESSRGAARVPVRIEPAVWQDEVERFDEHSAARSAAERERLGLETEGISRGLLERCADEAPDRTRLRGWVKAYVPLREAPASERPFGFVFRPAADNGGLVLVLMAFGERHPRSGTRSVYERAHKRRYGRYPDR